MQIQISPKYCTGECLWNKVFHVNDSHAKTKLSKIINFFMKFLNQRNLITMNEYEFIEVFSFRYVESM